MRLTKQDFEGYTTDELKYELDNGEYLHCEMAEIKSLIKNREYSQLIASGYKKTEYASSYEVTRQSHK